MAIYHLSLKSISRGKGRSAIAAAAYRSAERLENAREGLVHDFRAKAGVLATGIELPEGVEAPWARDRSSLWNAAEAAEKRRDAKTAQEFEVALPHELDAEQREELVRGFARMLADKYDAAADWAIHEPSLEGDGRNHHAHVMITVREVTAQGLGEKIALGREHAWLRRAGLASSRQQLTEIRESWADLGNAALARAGHDIRIDHRSHDARGLSLAPTEHVGVHAVQLARKGVRVIRAALSPSRSRWNAEVIGVAPEELLALVADEKSVFGERDIARAITRAVRDEADRAKAAEAVMSSPELVRIAPDDGGRCDRQRGPLYTTRRAIRLEAEMSRVVSGLVRDRAHGVARSAVEDVIGLRAETGDPWTPPLSGEQEAALRHVTGPEGIAVVTGRAGAGKSTMLAAAREAWERDGYRVLGAALAGKAADGLQEASGIKARTLGAWAWRWERGQEMPGPKDVLVVDEAGMLGTAQLTAILKQVRSAGAKVVLVGDADQLQPIGAGAPFRAVAELCGTAGLDTIHRQREDWQRQASEHLATGQVKEGLARYAARDRVRFRRRDSDAGLALAAEYAVDVMAHPGESRLALTHRRRDVVALNGMIRSALREKGLLGEVEQEVRTAVGQRSFTVGDKVMFLVNDSRLGVRNGSFGVVTGLEDGKIAVRPTGQGEGQGEAILLDMDARPAIDHGYAVTIHKAQGVTVDRAFVLASKSMDRHLAYVALTRHRESVLLLASSRTFGNLAGLSARLSRADSARNARDYAEGFLARRGFVGGMVERVASKAVELLGGTGAGALKDAFLKFPPPAPVEMPALDGETLALQKRVLAKELERSEGQMVPRDPTFIREQERQEAELEQQRRLARERDRAWSRSRGPELSLELSMDPW